MDNNESNLKPQSTGGLKLMTVFIVVLALHVLVIGGVTVYHLMSGGTDTDLTGDKSKDAKVSTDGSVVMDSPLPDASQPAQPAATESATPAPAIEQTAPAQTASAPVQDTTTPTGPVVTPAQPPAPAPISVPAPAPEPAVASEPVPVQEPTTAPTIQPETAVVAVMSGSYVVKMHDTLAKIAHRHHTTVAKLKAANELNGELLHVGQRLVIPGRTEVAAADTTGSTLLNASPAPTPEETETVAAPAPAPAVTHSSHHIYTVVKGDTLTRIAHKFRTTTKALMEANNITDPAKLSIGKKLTIPSRESQATTNVTPVPATTQPAQSKPAGQLANFVQ